MHCYQAPLRGSPSLAPVATSQSSNGSMLLAFMVYKNLVYRSWAILETGCGGCRVAVAERSFLGSKALQRANCGSHQSLKHTKQNTLSTNRSIWRLLQLFFFVLFVFDRRNVSVQLCVCINNIFHQFSAKFLHVKLKVYSPLFFLFFTYFWYC